MECYQVSEHIGGSPSLRLEPVRNTEGMVILEETDNLDAFYGFGYASLPHITDRLVKNGVIKVCLTEGDVPIELNMAIAGQLALINGVEVVALEVIRPTGRTGYRVIVTKDPERFPLGSKID